MSKHAESHSMLTADKTAAVRQPAGRPANICLDRIRSCRIVSAGLLLTCLLSSLFGCGSGSIDPTDVIPLVSVQPEADGKFHMLPGDSIQAVLDAAAVSVVKTVVIHEGDYRPREPGFAFIWFNAAHDGIQLIGEGQVVLHADNANIARAEDAGFPAVVNHILYFGDGITQATVVSGLRLTGANGFIAETENPAIKPDLAHPRLQKAQFYYEDGGAIKVFGRSYPTLEQLDVSDNYASPCAGGISIEHRGFNETPVIIRDCIFRNNRCRITGSGLDVLPGSHIRLENCLFTGNISNLGTDNVSRAGLEHSRENGSGALTVFSDSVVNAENCTFAFNWNGVDDKSSRNTYQNCIFWMNTLEGGVSAGSRYELDILSGANVKNCFIHGQVDDLRGALSSE